jgi:hypothetical protein
MDPISPTTQLNISLEAQQWNGVMAALVKAPYELAAPLIQSISQQLQQQVPQNGIDQMPMPPPTSPPPMSN